MRQEELKITGQGLTKHPLYSVWYDMIRRCLSPKRHNYKYYGGRGIKVCKDWLDFSNFIRDMYGTYQAGLTLDRIDNDGDYNSSNCRWVTKQVQALNRRERTNKSGFKGVYKTTRGIGWSAQLRRNGKLHTLGYFKTPELANEAVQKVYHAI